jgi:hypothetical protein
VHFMGVVGLREEGREARLEGSGSESFWNMVGRLMVSDGILLDAMNVC